MPDQAESYELTGGPERATRSFAGRVVRIVLIAFALVAGISLVVAALGRLPGDTGSGSLAIRASVGLAIGLVLTFFVRRMLRALTEPPPPAPPTVQASSADIVYECSVCGTRLRLEVAATGKAPRHCGEEMEPSVANR
ncbi:MAG: hypothetical protein WD646_14510 [Actinomycetota bacterium]